MIEYDHFEWNIEDDTLTSTYTVSDTLVDYPNNRYKEVLIENYECPIGEVSYTTTVITFNDMKSRSYNTLEEKCREEPYLGQMTIRDYIDNFDNKSSYDGVIKISWLDNDAHKFTYFGGEKPQHHLFDLQTKTLTAIVIDMEDPNVKLVYKVIRNRAAELHDSQFRIMTCHFEDK